MNQILYEAVNAKDKATQQQAELAITQMRANNPQAFFLQSIGIAINPAENQQIRQTAATIFARSVGLKHNQTIFWDFLDPQSKSTIRTHLINMLVDNSSKLRRAAGNVVAAICAIEVLRGGWLDIVSSLVDNVRNENAVIRRTSVTTLGFICEQLKQTGEPVSPDLSGKMLAGIIKGLEMSDTEEMKEMAVKALRDALPFVSPLLKDPAVLNCTIEAILRAAQTPDLVEYCLQALIEFSKNNYDLIAPYLPQFTAFTYPLLTADTPQAITALQLWDQIGQQYLQRKNRIKRVTQTQIGTNYLLMIHQSLTPLVLSSLLLVTQNSDNELRQAALRTMSTIADCCGNIVFETVKMFVSNTVAAEDWKLRQASVLAFSTLSEAEDRTTVEQMLAVVMDVFMGLTQDPHQFVVRSTLDGLAKIFEFHARIFLRHPNYEKYINTLTALLDSNQQSSCRSLQVILNLTEDLKNVQDCPLFNNIFPLLNTLTVKVCNCPNIAMIRTYWMCIINLLNICSDPDLAYKYIIHLMDKRASLQGSSEKDKTMIYGILSSMYSALLVLRNCCPQEAFFRQVYEFTLKHFKAINDVDVDGLYVVSGLSIVYKKAFQKVFQEFWPYLVHGLSKLNQPSTFKAALACLCDIARQIGSKFESKFNGILEQLLQAINMDINRDLKLAIFMAISDTLLAVGRYASPYLKRILQIVDLGMQGAIQLSKNPDQFDYAQSLKQASIDIYQCIGVAFTSNVNVNNLDPILLQHFPRMVFLTIETCNRKYNPTVIYLTNCIEMLTDSAYVLRQTNLLRTAQFKTMIDLLKEHQKGNQRIREVVEYADRMIFKKL